MRAVIIKIILFFFVFQTSAYGMSSVNYSIPSFKSNYGSGTRSSSNYLISSDAIVEQTTGSFSSSNYGIVGLGISSITDLEFVSSLYINADSQLTNTETIILNLTCGSESGCTEMMISNNGVSWSDPIHYATSIAWDLISNDGNRNVFVKFKNGNGVWSGISGDFIELDTTPPTTTISPISGTFMKNPGIALTASEPATIYYTIDGTDPTTASSVYFSPITLTSDTELKAFAVDSIGNTGPVASDLYIVCNGSNLTISGIMTDTTVDKGVPLATLTLNTGQTTTTDVDGNYSFTDLDRGYYIIEAIDALQSGYVTYQKELELCKTNITHEITLAQAATTLGSDTYAGYSAGSVNTGTGNFTYGFSDLNIPGKGFSFVFERNYNSQDSNDGPLGYGWTHNYNISLVEETEGNVTVRMGDGKTQTWLPDVSGGYDPMPGVFDTLIKNPDNTFKMIQKNLIQYNFNFSNKLASITDDNNNALTFTYSSNNVSEVTDTTGRVVNFSYDANDRITRIMDPMGRSVTMTYDLNGNLISSTDRGGNITSYTYNDEYQILTVTDPKGNVVLTNVYDDQSHAVISQIDALGGETLYSYNKAKKVTQIVNPMSNVSYHHYDDYLRLIKETDAKGNSSQRIYNELGQLEKAIDKNGNETLYKYDVFGNVLVKTDVLGSASSATYDSNNNPLTKTDENGNTTHYTYTDANLTSVEDKLGHTSSYNYDDDGQMLTKTNAHFKKTIYEYDQYGNTIAITDALSNKSSFVYDIVGRKLTESHPLGQSTAYEYDNMDSLLSVTDALGGVSSFVYDDNGNKIEHIDANNNKTAFRYDAKNRMISITNPLGQTETYTYDKLDRKISITNYRGFTSTINYDEVGNIILESDALKNQDRYEYDPNGNRTGTIDAMGNRTDFEYDELNRLTSVIDAFGNITAYTYDNNGNRLTVTDAQNNIAQSTYDKANRVKTITDPLLNTITNDYDELGQLVKITDPKLRETHFEYDDLGKLSKVTDAETGEVRVFYDAIGNRVSMTDPRGFSTTYEYDLLNRLTNETDPLSNSEIVTYDSVGNILSTSDANGTTQYAYDKLNRLINLTYPDSTTVAYSYDENGNRLSVMDIMGVTTYQYDKLDRILTVIDPFNMSVGYTYNSNGSRSSTIYPGNKTVSYFYDQLNRLISVQDWGGKTTRYQYDSLSRLTDQLMANGSTTQYAYDICGRLTDKVDRDPSINLISSYTYTLDKIGNRTGMEMQQPLLPQIDFIDNSFTHNDGSQVVTGNGSDFNYNGKGNRIDQSKYSVTTQYAYNYDNLMTRRQQETDIDEYNYNSDGHRLSSLINGVETRYLLDANNGMELILAEMDENNAIKTYYIHGDGLLYSIDATTNKMLYYHYDALGSTIALSDEHGNITDKYAYLPYGELSGQETTNENPFTYVGKYGVMKEDNGLYFMRARFYDPETKMFLTKDTIKPDMKNSQTMNPYVYTEGNPINGIDPNGEALLLGPALIMAVSAWIVIDTGLDYDAGKRDDFFGAVCSDTIGFYVPVKSMVVNIYNMVTGDEEKEVGGYQNSSHINSTEDQDGNVYYEEDKISEQSQYNMKNSSQLNYMKKSQNDNRSANVDISYSIIKNETKSYSNSPNSTFSPLAQKRKPKSYLSTSYSSRTFNKEFSKLKDPDLISNRTQSYIEMKISQELWKLQNKQYGYRDKKQKKKAKAKRAADVQNSISRIWSSLASSASKYSVIVRSLEQLPLDNSSYMNRGGVYGN